MIFLSTGKTNPSSLKFHDWLTRLIKLLPEQNSKPSLKKQKQKRSHKSQQTPIHPILDQKCKAINI